MKEKTFSIYKVDMKTVDKHAKDFADLFIEDKKDFCLSVSTKTTYMSITARSIMRSIK